MGNPVSSVDFFLLLYPASPIHVLTPQGIILMGQVRLLDVIGLQSESRNEALKNPQGRILLERKIPLRNQVSNMMVNVYVCVLSFRDTYMSSLAIISQYDSSTLQLELIPHGDLKTSLISIMI